MALTPKVRRSIQTERTTKALLPDAPSSAALQARAGAPEVRPADDQSVVIPTLADALALLAPFGSRIAGQPAGAAWTANARGVAILGTPRSR